MKNFAAIDFETANGQRSSVCSVGIIIVRDSQIVDSIYSLIHPAPNYFSPFCVKVHGLTRADCDAADYFPEVWAGIAPKIEGLPLVAHNARFDEGCLRAAHARYDMPYPDYRFLCTYRKAVKVFGRSLCNHQLHTVAAACGYDLKNHHHALADAEAAALIALKIFDDDEFRCNN